MVRIKLTGEKNKKENGQLVIIVDSREIRNMHILKVFNEQGVAWKVKKLEFGDYSFEVDGKSYEKECVIERKANLTELSGNFCKGRIRFENEFCRAKSVNCKMTLLVEDLKARDKMKLRVNMDNAGIDLETKKRKTWRSKFSGNSMIGSIKAFKDRYDLDLIFCSKVRTAKEIVGVFEKYLEGVEDAVKLCEGE